MPDGQQRTDADMANNKVANNKGANSTEANSTGAKATGAKTASDRPRGETFDDVEDFAGRLGPGARLMGIDAGTKTLGLALSDVTRTIASPLTVLRRTKFKQDAAQLLALAAEHKIAGFVLGLPTSLDGTAGPRVQATRALARNLNALSELPILLWDERLSTAAAERTLLEADTSRKRRAEVIDKLAATIILQSALDRMHKR
jgi:putative Holliday junction resolvase